MQRFVDKIPAQSKVLTPYNLYNLNSNQQLLIDGDNNWSNDNCLVESNKIDSSLGSSLGSCRNINKECIDFVNKDFCDKYKMKWSDKTCQQPSEYKWIDPIIISSPVLYKSDGVLKLF